MNETATLKSLSSGQKRRLLTCFLAIALIGTMFLTATGMALYNDRVSEAAYWSDYLTESETLTERLLLENPAATRVLVGTYLENFRELSLKNANYRVVFLAWFRWEGDPDLDMANHFRVYKGAMNSKQIVKDYHENGVNYQLVRCDVTVTKEFWARRFPLESHQLRFYLESDHPVERAVFIGDFDSSGYNSNLSIPGYSVMRSANSVQAMTYDNAHSDPEITGPVVTSEYLTAIEINRSGWGLYLKCFIALFGTTTWVLITLFICTYHHVDPLGMIPGALFGTVSNIMVGANLLPDALQTGLLEFVNLWGILTILAVAVAIININRIRNKYEDKAFATLFGRVMLYTIVFFVVLGHILLPTLSYLR